ncbi:unnamed protein product [Rangifer tarandus platyrhynchus]|uniref:Uncharacterized protein n=2 Tax=Rangifer tarandus platyrhynchus TaxID=3082113 RepID=A0ABN8XTF0_RANTA|nr:unnamed protein product [Rangifer tarandus platyrhynchus]
MKFIHHLFDFFKALLRLLAFSSPRPVGQLEPVALSFLPERPREVECKLGLEKLGSPTVRWGGRSLAVSFTRGGGVTGSRLLNPFSLLQATPCSSNRGAGPALSLGLVDKGEWTI